MLVKLFLAIQIIDILYNLEVYVMLNMFKAILKWFVFIRIVLSLTIATACIAWWEGMEIFEIFAFRMVKVAHFTDQNWISKTVYCFRCELVCKIGFTDGNPKIALLRSTMVGTYYINVFWTGADRHNGISMSLLLLVAETINFLDWHSLWMLCAILMFKWIAFSEGCFDQFIHSCLFFQDLKVYVLQ